MIQTLEPPVTADLAREFGLKAEEFDRIVQRLGRTPNYTELGLFSVMWSEHCSYKSSRLHLKRLPTSGPQVIQGPGENAGVVDIGDGLCVVFKMESHNHPSFIEPYQGAATGVGGIMRDVFTMGARPIALMNALRFGAPDHPKTRRLVAGVVSGIAGYGNCVGVPTVGGETNFHSSYNGNILVNAMCVGLARSDRLFKSAARGVGNPIVYVGSKTGRDGIHGATMASAEFDDASQEKRPTVQVGDPFVEKLLIEACLELMESDAILAIQDMGAAGLTSSSIEMAAKGGSGIELILDHVPQREEGMSAYEMMLSESQERMLMVLKPGREPDAERIMKKWGLDAAVIGVTTDTGRIVLKHRGQTVCDLPLAPLADEAPLYDRPFVRTLPPEDFDPETAPAPDDIGAALIRIMASPDMASKAWIWEQYDRHVMGDTAADSGGDAAVVRVHGTHKAIAISCDVTPRYCEADPYAGGMQAVAECYRNLSAVGARPLAVTDNLNFGNPERPEIMGQIVGAIDGMARACSALGFPVVSGNVSLYNETNGEAIKPTPAIGGVGLLEDVRIRAGYDRMRPDDQLILIGATSGHMGQSLYLREVVGLERGAAPPVDLAAEQRAGILVRKIIAGGLSDCVHDISDGGLLCAAAEMALASRTGLTLEKPDAMPAHLYYFGEDQARYLIAARPPQADEILRLAELSSIPARRIGAAGGLTVAGEDFAVALSDLRNAHEGWMPRYMAGKD